MTHYNPTTLTLLGPSGSFFHIASPVHSKQNCFNQEWATLDHQKGRTSDQKKSRFFQQPKRGHNPHVWKKISIHQEQESSLGLSTDTTIRVLGLPVRDYTSSRFSHTLTTVHVFGIPTKQSEIELCSYTGFCLKSRSAELDSPSATKTLDSEMAMAWRPT